MPTTNSETAQALLASSYYLAAKRIQDALAGIFFVRNSRSGVNPHQYTGEVVGLCGQGGKHPYFRILVTDLQIAADQIIAAFENARLQTGSNSQDLIDQIGNACQQLRAVTVFDTSTGCVNDSLPSVVPLLPPEEIWLDQQELPLDIWRMVSLEFDFVTTSIATQSEVSDFAFASITPSGLILRAMIAQLSGQTVTFRILPRRMPLPWRSEFPRSRQITVSLARIYFEAGCLLTPLASADHVQWYAVIRYLHWIDSTSLDFRVRDEFSNDTVDSRYRGLFAEETAIGAMAVILQDIFSTVRINNTVEINPALAGINAPVADFVAEAIHVTTGARVTLVAESKGSLGAKVKKQRRDRAKLQVRSTHPILPGSTSTLRLTFCSSFFFTSDAISSECIVSDPPSDNASDPFRVDAVSAWRLAYAKAFRFVGLETLSNQIVEGDGVDIPSMFRNTNNSQNIRSDRINLRNKRARIAQEKFGLQLMLDAEACAVAIDISLAEIFAEGINEVNISRIESALLRRKQNLAPGKASFITSLGLGCIFTMIYSNVVVTTCQSKTILPH